jgi:MFS family permease
MEESISSERHWTLDPLFRRFFLFAAIVGAICLLFGIFVNIVPLDETVIPLPMRIAGGLLGAVGAISVLSLWLSMLSYWWQVDRRERGMNVFWLLALSVGNWVGTVAYYFFFFRSIAKKAGRENSH